METKKVVRKKKVPKKHIVVFQDDQGTVLSSVFVKDGDSAVAPEMKEVLEVKEHHKVVFQGWDQPLDAIHSNLVVHPVYKEIPKEYLIMYFHEDGKILGSETVPYGQDAKAAFHPRKAENEEFFYHFDGWNCELTAIDSDRMAKAKFVAERKRFPVHFIGADGILLKEEMVSYGEDAHAPENVNKAADETFRYHFQGWDENFQGIRGPKTVSAIFEAEYIEYTIRFLEEGQMVEEKIYHYNDPVDYPELWKKGYDYIWNQEISRVTESVEVDGHWEYSNPKGKIIAHKTGLYEITNPSTARGTVRCLKYVSKEAIVTMPESVKLGDYFYQIDCIHADAFAECVNMRKIYCPSSLIYLEDRAFAGNKKLEEVVLGRNVNRLGANVFADSQHLYKIIFNGSKKIRLHRHSFAKANYRMEIIVPAKAEAQYDKIFEREVREKGYVICGK